MNKKEWNPNSRKKYLFTVKVVLTTPYPGTDRGMETHTLVTSHSPLHAIMQVAEKLRQDKVIGVKRISVIGEPIRKTDLRKPSVEQLASKISKEMDSKARR